MRDGTGCRPSSSGYSKVLIVQRKTSQLHVLLTLSFFNIQLGMLAFTRLHTFRLLFVTMYVHVFIYSTCDFVCVCMHACIRARVCMRVDVLCVRVDVLCVRVDVLCVRVYVHLCVRTCVCYVLWYFPCLCD
jgi:hypothetical protein